MKVFFLVVLGFVSIVKPSEAIAHAKLQFELTVSLADCRRDSSGKLVECGDSSEPTFETIAVELVPDFCGPGECINEGGSFEKAYVLQSQDQRHSLPVEIAVLVRRSFIRDLNQQPFFLVQAIISRQGAQPEEQRNAVLSFTSPDSDSGLLLEGARRAIPQDDGSVITLEPYVSVRSFKFIE